MTPDPEPGFAEAMPGRPETPNPRRSRRIYIYWGVALALLLTLGLFCWLVVVPVWQVQKAIGRLEAIAEREARSFSSRRMSAPPYYWASQSNDRLMALATEEGVKPLGGPEQAASAASLYLRAPERFAPDKALALVLAGACGGDASPLVPLIVRFIEDDDRNVRLTAVTALGRVGDPKALEHLVPLLASGSDQALRRRVIEALGRIGDARAADHLLPLLKKGVPEETRVAAVTALGRLRDERCFRAVIAVTQDQSRWVRRSAVQALGRMGGVRVLEPLEAAAKDRDDLVSTDAKESLKRIRKELDTGSKLVVIGTVAGEWGKRHAELALKCKGIPYELGTGDPCDISVPEWRRQEAIDILRRDAERRRYKVVWQVPQRSSE